MRRNEEMWGVFIMAKGRVESKVHELEMNDEVVTAVVTFLTYFIYLFI